MVSRFRLRILLLVVCFSVTNGDSTRIIFPTEDNPRSPSRQTQPQKPRTQPRSSFNNGNSFNIQPLSTGGFSGSGSVSSNYVGNGHSASQSSAFSFNAGGGSTGFSSSQSASQSSSFNTPGTGHRGPALASSQASSQSSSFSGTHGGGGGGGGATSSASSQASSVGFAAPSGANHGASLSSSSADSHSSVASFGGNGNTGYGGHDPYQMIPDEFVRGRRPSGNRGTNQRRRAQDVTRPFYDLYRQLWSGGQRSLRRNRRWSK